MKINDLKQILIHIDECDRMYESQELINFGEMSTGMRDTIRFAIEQRKANLIDRLRDNGLRVEV